MKTLNIFSVLITFACLVSCEQKILNKPPVVEAGASQSIRLPNAQFTLTGSGVDPEEGELTFLWSQIEGPAASHILSPTSAITLVNATSVGSYLFQLTAIDNQGLSGFDTVRVYILPSEMISLTVKPANNSNEIHLQGNNITDYNSPTAPELVAGYWTVFGETMAMRGAIKFDLSQIPSNATIVSAKLSLYSNPTPINGDHSGAANSGTNNAMVIQRVTSNWNNTITWQTQPSSTNIDEIEFPHTSSSHLDLIDIDVKKLVQQMVSGANYGFLIRLKQEGNLYNIRNFCSSKHAQASKHPKLVVEYIIDGSD